MDGIAERERHLLSPYRSLCAVSNYVLMAGIWVWLNHSALYI